MRYAGKVTPALCLDDPIELTAQLIDIPSVSHDEHALADAVHSALEPLSHLDVQRVGNTIVACTRNSTDQQDDKRVILAGHLDTVPIAHNIPHTRRADRIAGLGAVDMKSGDAVFLHLAKTLTHPSKKITYIFYDCEEVESYHNGLGKLYQVCPEVFTADIAILGEPTQGWIEAGCQGSLRGKIETHGIRAHAARSWLGSNAITALAPPLTAASRYTSLVVPVDGLEYRESVNVVNIAGGIAGNVIPDYACMEVNYRFAPDKTISEAQKYVEDYFAPSLGDNCTFTVTDIAAAAAPGLGQQIAQELVQVAQGKVRAKYGWTDVARFAALGIPAVNLGPGDPSLAHKPEEYVMIDEIAYVTTVLTQFLQ